MACRDSSRRLRTEEGIWGVEREFAASCRNAANLRMWPGASLGAASSPFGPFEENRRPTGICNEPARGESSGVAETDLPVSSGAFGPVGTNRPRRLAFSGRVGMERPTSSGISGTVGMERPTPSGGSGRVGMKRPTPSVIFGRVGMKRPRGGRAELG